MPSALPYLEESLAPRFSKGLLFLIIPSLVAWLLSIVVLAITLTIGGWAPDFVKNVSVRNALGLFLIIGFILVCVLAIPGLILAFIGHRLINRQPPPPRTAFVMRLTLIASGIFGFYGCFSGFILTGLSLLGTFAFTLLGALVTYLISAHAIWTIYSRSPKLTAQ